MVLTDYITDPTAQKKVTPTGTPTQTAGNAGVFDPTAAAAPTATMPQGIDPALAQIYQNAGQTPGGRGTGFADWQYWQGVGPSQYSRLASDIAGTGPDQTTGTPWGAGAWQNSGRGGGGFSGVPTGNVGLQAAQNGLAALLQGNPIAGINQALGNIGAQGGDYLQGLIAALNGGR